MYINRKPKISFEIFEITILFRLNIENMFKLFISNGRKHLSSFLVLCCIYLYTLWLDFILQNIKFEKIDGGTYYPADLCKNSVNSF